MSGQLTRELFDFIEGSPSCFHAVESMRRQLGDAGYTQLLESKQWNLVPGGKYYVIRNGSSLIAFRIPVAEIRGFQIMASHSDSPCFKIKENPEMEAEGHYVRLNVEKYGGMLMAPWFDRPLSVAGRLMVREDGQIKTKLVNVDRDLLMIPNLAIHMNREANDGMKYNVQKDLLPLYGDGTAKGSFSKLIAQTAGVLPETVIGSDLFLYNRMPGSIWGANREFISIGKLDDLQCAFSSLKGFLEAEEGESIPVHCVFDNEEVGSGTRQGAASTFLYDTLANICGSLGKTMMEYRRLLASSFMLSADNAQGVHPNYMDKACPTNRPYLNGGIVIKYSANQKYTTDGIAAAVFKEICAMAEVPYQNYVNRADIPGGSTLGNISGTQVAVATVDIGLAQLAMHSPYETGGIHDTEYLVRAAKVFFESAVQETGYGSFRIRHGGLAGTRIPLESLPNTRDLGGIRTADGRVIRPHRLLRSGALAGISDADRDILLKEYSLRTVIDFRTDTEREEKPDPEIEGVRLIINPIAEEETMGITRGRKGLLELLDLKQDADTLMMEIYPRLVGDELSRARYARFFELLLSQEEGAVLWHCSAGKDRAGLGAALVLSALGVPEDIIREDYLLTNVYMQPANDFLLSQLAEASGVSAEKLAKVKTIFDAKEAYFDSALNYIKNEYGTVTEYLEKALGMDAEKLQKLQQMYLMEE